MTEIPSALKKLNINFSSDSNMTRNVRMLIAGEHGAGKTTLALTAPGTLFLTAKPGWSTLAQNQVPYIEISSIERMNDVVTALQYGVIPDIETVVVDCLDEMFRRIFEERLRVERRDYTKPEDWGWIARKFNEFLESLSRLRHNLIIITHLKSVENSSNQVLEKQLNLQGSLAVDVFKYVEYAGVVSSYSYLPEAEPGVESEVMREWRFDLTANDTMPWAFDKTGQSDNLSAVSAFQEIFDLRQAFETAESRSPLEVILAPLQDVPSKPLTPGMSSAEELNDLLGLS